MPDVDTISSEKNDKKDHQICDLEELKSYKYLLGDFGVSMLKAISQGAEDGDAIMMLSGVPAACITGRIPVLNNLKLNSLIFFILNLLYATPTVQTKPYAIKTHPQYAVYPRSHR